MSQIASQPPAPRRSAQQSEWGAERVDPSVYEPIEKRRWAADSTLVVLDMRHLAYRAFYTISPPPLDGRQRSMTLRIMLDSINAVTSAANTSRVLLVDDGSIEYKRVAYPNYKSRQDKKDDPERARLSQIFEQHYALAREFFEKNSVPVLHLPDLEADDCAGLVVGSLLRRASPVERILLVTDDKDWYQLVRAADGNSPEVLLWRGVRKRIVDLPAFVSEFGFQPTAYPHYKALVGEPAHGDNIPGVGGIGDVTAGKMVAASGTLDEIIKQCKLACSTKKPKKVEQSVVGSEADARLSLRLSTISLSAHDLVSLWSFSKMKAAAMLQVVDREVDRVLRTPRYSVGSSAAFVDPLKRDGVNPSAALEAVARVSAKP